MKHVFVVNPVAGTTDKTEEIIQKVRSLLKEDEYEIHITTSEDDAENFVREYLKNFNEKVRFYACGGDGTLNGVINGAALHENSEVTCYPIGSGNDFLRYFGHPIKFLNLENLIYGNIVKSDLIKFNDKYCINVLNVGFDGGVAYRQKRIKRWPLVSGGMAYNISLFISVLGRLNHKVKLSVDGDLIYEGKSALAAMANGVCYGGGYYCAPKAKINDGLIDICLIKKVNLIKFASLVKSYKNGTYLENEKAKDIIFYLKGKHVELELEKKLYCSNDGEITKVDKVVLDIFPNAISFVVTRDL